MISGKFVDSRVILPVRFLLPGDMSFTIDFVVDTGFSGYLTLPASAIGAMNLSLCSTTVGILADGTESLLPTHLANIDWHNQSLLVPVLAMGQKPLLGIGLLRSCRLVFELVEGGVVEVAKL
jgi:clan AA aspartic protease